MRKSAKITAAGAGVVLLLGAGAGVAVGASSDDDATETPITGADLEKASTAALEATGGGEVTGTEVGDEESRYEVEVTKDGKAVDVQLDEAFEVVSTEADDDGAGE